MSYSLRLPNGQIVSGIDDAFTREEAYAVLRKKMPEAFASEVQEVAAPVQKKGGVFGALGKGTESAIESGVTGISALFGDKKEAAKEAIKRSDAIDARYENFGDLEKVKAVYEKDGFMAAAREVIRQFPDVVAENIPNIVAMAAGAKAGAALGSLAGPGGALVGGLAGGLSGSAGLQFGSNIERQARAQQAAGQEIDPNLVTAGGAALAQGALDVASFKLLAGKTLGKYFGLAGKEGTEAAEKALVEAAKKSLAATTATAQRGLWATAGRGVVTGIGAEVPTEIAQQVLERWQAGLPLLDEDAQREYAQTAYQTTMVGGALGPVGSITDRQAARGELAKKERDDAIAAKKAADEAEAARKATPEYQNSVEGLEERKAALKKEADDLKRKISAIKTPEKGAELPPDEQQTKEELSAQHKALLAQINAVSKQVVEAKKSPEQRFIEQVMTPPEEVPLAKRAAAPEVTEPDVAKWEDDTRKQMLADGKKPAEIAAYIAQSRRMRGIYPEQAQTSGLNFDAQTGEATDALLLSLTDPAGYKLWTDQAQRERDAGQFPRFGEAGQLAAPVEHMAPVFGPNGKVVGYRPIDPQEAVGRPDFELGTSLPAMEQQGLELGPPPEGPAPSLQLPTYPYGSPPAPPPETPGDLRRFNARKDVVVKNPKALPGMGPESRRIASADSVPNELRARSADLKQGIGFAAIPGFNNVQGRNTPLPPQRRGFLKPEEEQAPQGELPVGDRGAAAAETLLRESMRTDPNDPNVIPAEALPLDKKKTRALTPQSTNNLPVTNSLQGTGEVKIEQEGVQTHSAENRRVNVAMLKARLNQAYEELVTLIEDFRTTKNRKDPYTKVRRPGANAIVLKGDRDSLLKRIDEVRQRVLSLNLREVNERRAMAGLMPMTREELTALDQIDAALRELIVRGTAPKGKSTPNPRLFTLWEKGAIRTRKEAEETRDAILRIRQEMADLYAQQYGVHAYIGTDAFKQLGQAQQNWEITANALIERELALSNKLYKWFSGKGKRQIINWWDKNNQFQSHPEKSDREAYSAWMKETTDRAMTRPFAKFNEAVQAITEQIERVKDRMSKDISGPRRKEQGSGFQLGPQYLTDTPPTNPLPLAAPVKEHTQWAGVPIGPAGFPVSPPSIAPEPVDQPFEDAALEAEATGKQDTLPTFAPRGASLELVHMFQTKARIERFNLQLVLSYIQRAVQDRVNKTRTEGKLIEKLEEAEKTLNSIAKRIKSHEYVAEHKQLVDTLREDRDRAAEQVALYEEQLTQALADMQEQRKFFALPMLPTTAVTPSKLMYARTERGNEQAVNELMNKQMVNQPVGRRQHLLFQTAEEAAADQAPVAGETEQVRFARKFVNAARMTLARIEKEMEPYRELDALLNEYEEAAILVNHIRDRAREAGEAAYAAAATVRIKLAEASDRLNLAANRVEEAIDGVVEPLDGAQRFDMKRTDGALRTVHEMLDPDTREKREQEQAKTDNPPKPKKGAEPVVEEPFKNRFQKLYRRRQARIEAENAVTPEDVVDQEVNAEQERIALAYRNDRRNLRAAIRTMKELQAAAKTLEGKETKEALAVREALAEAEQAVAEIRRARSSKIAPNRILMMVQDAEERVRFLEKAVESNGPRSRSQAAVAARHALAEAKVTLRTLQKQSEKIRKEQANISAMARIGFVHEGARRFEGEKAVQERDIGIRSFEAETGEKVPRVKNSKQDAEMSPAEIKAKTDADLDAMEGGFEGAPVWGPDNESDTAFRTGRAATAITPEEATELAAKAKQLIPNLVYVPTFDQMPVSLAKQIAKDGGDPRAVKGGVLRDGTVFMVGEAHADAADFDATVAHELVGHYKMDRILFGSKTGYQLMQEIAAKHIPDELAARNLMVELGFDNAVIEQVLQDGRDAAKAGQDGNLRNLREIVARTSEMKPGSFGPKAKGFWNTLVQAFKDLMRGFGINVGKLTADDIHFLVKSAQRGEVRTQQGGGTAFRTEVRTPANLQQASRQFIPETPGVLKSLTKNGWGMIFRTQFVDRFEPFVRVAREMLDNVKASQLMYYLRMTDRVNQLTAESLTNGAIALEKTKDGKGYLYQSHAGANVRDIVNVLKGEDFRTWYTYIALERAQVVGTEKLLGEELQRISPAQQAEILAYGRSNEAFQTARKMYREYNAKLIKLLLDTGDITEKAAADWASRDYIPYFRKDELGDIWMMGDHPIKIGNIRDQKDIAHLVGSDKALDDPFENIARNTRILVGTAVRNMAAKNTAHEFHTLGLGTFAKGDAKNHLGRNVIHFKEHGEDRSFLVNTSDSKNEALRDIPGDILAKSLEGIATQVPTILKLLQVPTKFLRDAITLNPLYMVRQLTRDPMHAWLSTGMDTKALLDAYKRVGNLMVHKDKTGNLLRERGLVGGQLIQGTDEDMSRIMSQLHAGENVWSKAVSWLHDKGVAADATTRAALYDNFIDKGFSELEATMATMDSINFATRGLSSSVQMANMLVPFFNAQIQGLDSVWRALSGQMPFNERLEARQKLVQRAMLLAATTVAYYALVEDEDWYKNTPENVRLMNTLIKLPGVDEPIRLPRPFEFGMAFMAIPEAIMMASKGDPEAKAAWAALRNQMANQIPGGSSFMLPAAMKPVVEVAANHSFFTGKPIVPSGMEDAPAEDQWTPNTTESAKVITGMLGNVVSPMHVEHLIKGYTAAIGYSTLQLLDSALTSTSVPKPDKPMSRWAVVGPAFQQTDGAAIITRAYDQAEKFQSAQKRFNAAKEQGRIEDAQEVLDKMPNELAKAKSAGQFRQKMGELTKIEKQVHFAPSLSSEEKTAMLKQLRQAKIDLATQYENAWR